MQDLARQSCTCSGDVAVTEGLRSLFSRQGQQNLAAGLHSSARCQDAADPRAASSEQAGEAQQELDRRAVSMHGMRLSFPTAHCSVCIKRKALGEQAHRQVGKQSVLPLPSPPRSS